MVDDNKIYNGMNDRGGIIRASRRRTRRRTNQNLQPRTNGEGTANVRASAKT